MMAEPDDPIGNLPAYEVVDHTADWSIRVNGANLAELFRNAALGMSSLMVADLADVPLDVQRQVRLAAFDAETLLVDWLSELAFWAENELLVFSRFELQELSPTDLTAVVWGGKVTGLIKHIKAVTFHELVIAETPGGLTVTIVFDV